MASMSLGDSPLVNQAIATGQCQNESVGYQVHFCEDNQESWILASRVMGGYPALCQKPLWTSDVLFFPSPFRSYLVKVLRVSSFCTLPPLPAIGRCVCAVLTDYFRTSSCYQIPELGLCVCVWRGVVLSVHLGVKSLHQICFSDQDTATECVGKPSLVLRPLGLCRELHLNQGN